VNGTPNPSSASRTARPSFPANGPPASELWTDQRVYDALHARLRSRLRRRCPESDSDAIFDSVSDALFAYYQDPTVFDPSRGVALDHFLEGCARRMLLKRMRSERRRCQRQTEYHLAARVMEEWEDRSENGPPESDAFQRLALARVRDPKDRSVLELWLRGERRTRAYAQRLSMEHFPVAHQRREIARRKNRIYQKLKRHFRKNFCEVEHPFSG